MKRRIVPLLIFLLLGAIANVAVAWGCAAWSTVSSHTINPFSHWGVLSRHDKEWLARIEWEPRTESDELTFRTHVRFSWGFGLWRCDYLEVQELKVGERPMIVSSNMSLFSLRIRSGWPCRSQQGGIGIGGSKPTRLSAGFASRFRRIVTSQHAAVVLPDMFVYAGGNEPRILPLEPIWPGFAINTLFYAAILWLLLALPGALRRRRRIKRGLCPACAYPVGASDLCTECGKPVRVISVEPAPS